jgi:sortase A
LKVTVVLKMPGATKWMERCLWAIGFLALAAWFGVWFNARQQKAAGNLELDRRLETRRGMGASRAPSVSPDKSTRARPAQGALVGRIEIPRLHVSTIIFEGTGDNVLSIGVGHLSGTALPGEQGNVVLAAHRDTFFRPLRSIHRDDRIVVVTPAGTRRYQVDLSEIVSPNYIEVLAPTPGATLTLVTCYPFEWLGHAPRRFIVQAHEVDDPTRSGSLASAVKERPRAEEAEEAEGKTSVDNSPPIYSRPVPEKRAAIRPIPVHTIALSQSEPVAGKAGTAPRAAQAKPPVLDKPTPPVKEIAAVQASRQASLHAPQAVQETAVPQTSGPELEADSTQGPQGNRIVRGVKKLNPKRLFGKIRGQ